MRNLRCTGLRKPRRTAIAKHVPFHGGAGVVIFSAADCMPSSERPKAKYLYAVT